MARKCPVGEVFVEEVASQGIVHLEKCLSGRCLWGICPQETVSQGTVRIPTAVGKKIFSKLQVTKINYFLTNERQRTTAELMNNIQGIANASVPPAPNKVYHGVIENKWKNGSILHKTILKPLLSEQNITISWRVKCHKRNFKLKYTSLFSATKRWLPLWKV